jgi:hypothetical protein
MHSDITATDGDFISHATVGRAEIPLKPVFPDAFHGSLVDLIKFQALLDGTRPASRSTG